MYIIGNSFINIVCCAMLMTSVFGFTSRAAQVSNPSTCTPIYLDVGHSAKHPGAISARGVTEYEFNKRFVSELGSQFAEKGSPKVEMLSENNLDLDLKQRTGRIKQFKYGILLSIHHDSVQPRYLSEWEHNKKQRKYSDLFFGFSLFVSAKSIAFSESVDSAQKLGEEFVKAGFLPSLHHNEPIPGENRPLLDGKIGLYRFDELAVLRHSKIPAVLVEVGIIVNREEENKLNNLVYRMQFQKALAGAVSRFCEQGRLD